MSQNVPPAPTVPKNSNSDLMNKNKSATHRLRAELMTVMKAQNDKKITVSAFPEGGNILKWVATVEGPPDTVYEGLTYKLSMEFPEDYPFKPPAIKFTSFCFHPNVDRHGNICLDILKDKWAASLDVIAILLSIQSLLGEPNNDSPLNPEAARLWTNQVAYKTYLNKNSEKK